MGEWKIFILRLNHRPNRDKRVTTHLRLAARAFGASGAYYTGQRDEKVEASVQKVNQSWGSYFYVEHVKNWRGIIKQWKEGEGEIIHLTMYGLPVQQIIEQMKMSPRDKLIIVGGAKVPSEVYDLADWNASVTTQPHSEISALSVFLHMLFEGHELSTSFENAEIRIVPQSKGKSIMRNSSRPNIT